MDCEVLLQSWSEPSFAYIQALVGELESSDCINIIVIQLMSGNIVLDHQIKTHDSWVARVEFLHETSPELSQLAKSMVQPQWMDVNILYAEPVHPLEVTTQSTGRGVELNFTSKFKPCEDYALGKAKKSGVSKKAVEPFKFWEKGCSSISAYLWLRHLVAEQIGCLSQITAPNLHWVFF